ncbi:MAG: hypothetical protein KAS32_05545 [Candidatus Peribacteraceae bacterium]|nr:hypothetical protein [Candidatus Peribacteraceae bacterium]
MTRTNPIWLATQNEEDVSNKHYKRSIRYYKKLWQAWPVWADDKKMEALYKLKSFIRSLGFDVMVDHAVPICHPHVSGLHNEFNTQILTGPENLSKGNHWWPDMWEEQLGLPIPMQDKIVWGKNSSEEDIRRVCEEAKVPHLQPRYIKAQVEEGKSLGTQKNLPL